MSKSFTKSVVEDAALAWREATGWHVAHGPDLAPEMPLAEGTLRVARDMAEFREPRK